MSYLALPHENPESDTPKREILWHRDAGGWANLSARASEREDTGKLTLTHTTRRRVVIPVS